MLLKAWNSKGEMPYCFARSSIKFQGYTVQNITDFDPNWAFSDYRPVAAFKSFRFAWFLFDFDLEDNYFAMIVGFIKHGYIKVNLLLDLWVSEDTFDKLMGIKLHCYLLQNGHL